MPRRRALAECHFVCNIQPLAESEVDEQSQRTGRVEQVEGRFAASVQGVDRALTGMPKSGSWEAWDGAKVSSRLPVISKRGSRAGVKEKDSELTLCRRVAAGLAFCRLTGQSLWTST